jgi:serine/threonine protein kinase
MQPTPPTPTAPTAPDDLLRAAIGTEGDAPPDPGELAPHLPAFEILALLGQGGMGAVYRVRRRTDGAAFALKVVRPGPGQEAVFAARFAREAEALARLHHPNIVAIYGHGRAGPWCWLLMDLVEGANLREIVATGRLSPAQTLALVPPLCAALQYAHDQGVVHRDLKPENILLDATGVPHLVDFGLAKLRDGDAASGLTNTGASMGTVHYMAPEQVASAKGVDHRADIYALGVVIYELLTGQLPLGRFESPSQRVQVDVRIDEVVLKALERDPERRWQQMRQVGKAVADVGGAAPVAISAGWFPADWLGRLLIGVAGSLLSLYGYSVWKNVWEKEGFMFLFFGCILFTYALMPAGYRKPKLSRWAWISIVVVLVILLVCWWIITMTSSIRENSPPVGSHQVRPEPVPTGVRPDPTMAGPEPVVVRPEPERPLPSVVTLSANLTAAEREAFQAKLRQRVTLKYKGVKISEVLQPLYQTAGLNYLIRDHTIDKETLTVHLEDVTIENVLRAIAARCKVRMSYADNTLILDAVEDVPTPSRLQARPPVVLKGSPQVPTNMARP